MEVLSDQQAQAIDVDSDTENEKRVMWTPEEDDVTPKILQHFKIAKLIYLCIGVSI